MGKKTVDDYIAYYSKLASGYDELYRDEQRAKLQVAWSEGTLKGLFDGVSFILDVGCGTGISSDFFAEKGFKVTGVDPTKELIEHNAHSKKLSTFVVALAEKMPFENRSFDLVVSFTAIQNFEDIEQGLREIRRVGTHKWLLTYLKGTKRDAEIKEAIDKVFAGREQYLLSSYTKDVILIISC